MSGPERPGGGTFRRHPIFATNLLRLAVGENNMPQHVLNPFPDGWTAKHAAVCAEHLLDDHGQQVLAVLRHPTYPYAGFVASGGGLDNGLRDIATAYIDRVRQVHPLGPAGDWLLGADDDGFGWLDIGWGGIGGNTDPRLSFWVARGEGESGVDRSVVLLAANRHRLATGQQCCEGLSIGLRVVMHLANMPVGASPRVRVQVTGLSASRLWLARAPQQQYVKATAQQSRQPGVQAAAMPGDQHAVGRLAETAKGAKTRTSVQQPSLDHRAFRDAICVFEQASNTERDTARPYALTGEVSQLKVRPALAGTTQVYAGANGKRAPKPVKVRLVDNQADPRIEVRQSIVSDLLNDPGKVQAVDPTDLPLRGDHASAVQAYLRGKELLDRLDAYGLDTAHYFKLARLPLLMRHRAWFFSQPDGLAVNAMVRPERAAQSLVEDFEATDRPRLEVLFGATSLDHQALREDDHGRLRAQPLGLAADPRWAWHEFGHVLSYAATGALEFHFAHSAGDALAAIVSDPDSKLAVDAHGRRDALLSGLTFPWVKLARRHDRQASLGWCWCGQRNSQRNVPFRLPALLYKGYVEEQMLSSSLFRLYCVLGGDTFTQQAQRHAASDYCIYLVMRAIALLGPAAVVPALTPGAFVSALIDADVGTGDWVVRMPRPDPQRPQVRRRLGGSAHKVIRWAFEQQGLYATDQPQEFTLGEGRPPAVDLYVPGLGDRLNGGYAPVALVWAERKGQAAPLWHADARALCLVGHELVMSVHNRGQCRALAVGARAWAAPADTTRLQWQPLSASGAQPNDVSVAGVVQFKFAAKDSSGKPLAGPWFVLVEANCRDDRANLHPDAGLPCSSDMPPSGRRELIDLVANDNNLGLRRVDFG